MTRVLLNAAIINRGGSLQVAVNFIIKTILEPVDIQWYYLISKPISEALIFAEILLDPKIYLVMENSPSKFMKRRKTLAKIHALVEKFKPEIVYSIGSPSYIYFKVPEVQRLTNAWITHPNPYAFKTLQFKERITIKLKTKIQIFYLRKVQYFITQTERSKSGILQITNVNPKNVKIIPNTLSPVFYELKEKNTEYDNCIYIFSISAAYPHKNLDIIPKVAEVLKKQFGLTNFKFILTLPKNNSIIRKINKLSIANNTFDNILNIGPIPQTECVYYYKLCTCVFLPTLLETSSATFIESMYCERPIITTDIDICRELCKDAALYFNPFDYFSAADKIQSIICNEDLRQDLIVKGREVLKEYDHHSNNYNETISFLKSILTT